MRQPAQGKARIASSDPEWNNGNAYVTIAMLTVLEFLERDGASPFGNWFTALDAIAAAKITTVVRRLELGNFSNVKGVGPACSSTESTSDPAIASTSPRTATPW